MLHLPDSQTIYPEDIKVQPETEISETEIPMERRVGTTFAQYLPPTDENPIHRITLNSHDGAKLDVLLLSNAPFEATSQVLSHQIALDYWRYHHIRVGDLMKAYGRHSRDEILIAQRELSIEHEHVHREQQVRGLLIDLTMIHYPREGDNHSLRGTLAHQYNAAMTTKALTELQAEILGYRGLQHKPDIQSFMFGREYGIALYLLENSPINRRRNRMDMSYAIIREGLNLAHLREVRLHDEILILTRNPNIVEEIQDGKVSRRKFKSLLREGLRMLGKHPGKLLANLLSEEFQKPLDQKILQSANHLRNLTIDIAKYKESIGDPKNDPIHDFISETNRE